MSATGCGTERHPYQLYLALNEIEHRTTRVGTPRTNGFALRFHGTVLQEFFRPALDQKLYDSAEALQADLDAWLQHSDRRTTPLRPPRPMAPTIGNDRPVRQTRSLRGSLTEPWVLCRASELPDARLQRFRHDPSGERREHDPCPRFHPQRCGRPRPARPRTCSTSTARANNRTGHDLRHLPSNCHYVGYLAVEQYNACVAGAAAVLGLTTQERIQLSCAGEAMAAGVPMVLADTETLRGLFYKGTCHVDVRAPESIAGGCRRALRDRKRLRQEVAELRRERAERWREQMNRLQPVFFGP